MRSAQKLLMPGGPILIGVLLIAHGFDWPERVPPLARIVPGVIYALGILLGARFHSAQMVLALVALAIIDVTLAFFAPQDLSAAGSTGRRTRKDPPPRPFLRGRSAPCAW